MGLGDNALGENTTGADNAIGLTLPPQALTSLLLAVIRLALEELEKAAAWERMTLGKVSTGSDPGKTRDRIGARAGVSGRTVEKIAEVCEAAEAEPEKFGHLVEEMDRTGKIGEVHRKLKKAWEERRSCRLSLLWASTADLFIAVSIRRDH